MMPPQCLVATLLLAAACTGGGAVPSTSGAAPSASSERDAATTEPATTISASSSSILTTTLQTPTTLAPATTVTGEAELPDTDGDDPALAWDGITAFFSHLSVAPDADAVSLIVEPDCPCFRGYVEAIAQLEDNGWRYTGEAPTRTTSFTVVEEISPTEVVALVHTESPADRILDSSGATVRREEARRATLSLFLRRGEDGRWRIAGIVDAG